MESFMKKFVLSLSSDSDGRSRNTDIGNSLHSIVVRGNSGHICKGEIIIPMKSTKIAQLVDSNKDWLLCSCIASPCNETFSNTKRILSKLKIPVDKICIEKNLLCFSLIRDDMIKSTMTSVIGAGHHYGQSTMLHSKKFVIVHDTASKKEEPLNLYRGYVLQRHIESCLKFAGAKVEAVHQTEIVCESESKQSRKSDKMKIANSLEDCYEHKNSGSEENLTIIYLRSSGKSIARDHLDSAEILKYKHIINTETGKAWRVPAENLFKITWDELKNAMELKYGNVVGQKSVDFLEQEAHNCMTLFLLSKSYSDDLRVDTDNGALNTKESAFILYNYARLKMIFKSFDSKISDGSLPPLPDIKEVDFSLLKHDEEWTIVWEFIIRLPEIVEEFATVILKNPTKVKTSTLVKFLNSLSHRFSVYYRRFRVLVSGEFPHLLPLMYSRLYFLKAIIIIMDVCFFLLGVDSPPDCM